MASPSSKKLIVCYPLGAGAGFDMGLGALGRQLCEDFAEMIASDERLITIPQMIVVRETPEIDYAPERKATAFAVFYSLPETQWVMDATRAIGGDVALTGRVVDDESGLLLSVNMVDVQSGLLLFCGYETCARDEIQIAAAKLAARLLNCYMETPYDAAYAAAEGILGTKSYTAYMNWLNMRELERRAQREGKAPPYARMAEYLTRAIDADKSYSRASLRLCELLSRQLERPTYEFILRYLEPLYNTDEAIALITVQCAARIGKRSNAVSMLNGIISKFPENGLFPLMRGSLATDEREASKDLAEARRMLGNDFNGCRAAVDNALLNVTGI